ncbi:hypothetical protein GCM10009866_11690 [Cellulomonas aerilata]
MPRTVRPSRADDMQAAGHGPTMDAAHGRRAPPREENAMGLDDLTDKATGAAGGGAGEKVSDAALDKGEDAASGATGGKADGMLAKAGDAADERIGGQ